MIINQANLSALFTGFKAAFNQGFRSAEPMWGEVATLVPSTTSQETYAWLGQFPQLREWIGDRQIKSMSAYGYTIVNRDFESTIGVNRNHLDDDQFGIYNPLFQEMGYAAATHPDSLVFALLAAGATTLCYDNQYFFDTDHPVAGQSVSNFGGGAGTAWYLLDTTRPLKPLIFQRRKDYNLIALQDEKDEGVFMRKEYRYGVDARVNVGFGFWQMAYMSKQTLDTTNYAAARAAMMNFKSDEGRPLNIKPTLLVVPPSLEKAAFEVLYAQRLANGSDNVYHNTAKVLVCPWLV